jgi:acyl-CoA oxidase
MSCHVVHNHNHNRNHNHLQDPLYRYNGYLSLMEFREQTLQRLQKFVAQRYFSVRDYLDGACIRAIRQ